jgi:hypothetical protein
MVKKLIQTDGCQVPQRDFKARCVMSEYVSISLDIEVVVNDHPPIANFD